MIQNFLQHKKTIQDVSVLFFFCIFIILLIKIKNQVNPQDKMRIAIIGDGKTINVRIIRPIVPHPAVILYNSGGNWIVNVPLTPFKSQYIEFPDVQLPPFLLWKPQMITQPRDQGSCGSCWCFSVCSMLSDRAIIATGDINIPSLSVQQVLSCFNSKNNNCSGGSPEEASIWLATQQLVIVPESKRRYRQFKGESINTPCVYYNGGYGIQVRKNSVYSLAHFIEEQKSDPLTQSIIDHNVLNMKRALMSGPFYCAMTVYNDFFVYNGLTPYTPASGAPVIGGHAIEVIGYCNQGEDTRPDYNKYAYWICKNSWGNDWPTKSALPGYFTIPMGINCCGIESRSGFCDPVVHYPNGKQKTNPTTRQDMLYTSFHDYKT